MIRSALVDVFLALAVLLVLASCVGLLVMRDVYQRLHYVTPVALIAPVLLGLAVLAQSGWSESSSLDLAGAAVHDHRRALPDPCHHPRGADQGDGGTGVPDAAARTAIPRRGPGGRPVMMAAHAVVTPYTVSPALMDVLQVTLLVLVAAGATAVALTRAPVRQVIVLSGYGLLLALLFLAFQAPDVTLSELTVGAVALPLLLLLALAKVRKREK